ncbi:TolB-like protein [Flavobacteriaceae bacterium MAR_2010_72]|nr:TolB-like protein [Flavobacteriaceae bacterium MAR_2010_72]
MLIFLHLAEVIQGMIFKNFYDELKRRNVIKACLAYLVTSWIIIQVISSVLPIIAAPAYVSKLILIILAIGFPFWFIFSWVYEITPDGIKRTVSIKPEESIAPETSNRLNKIIIAGLVIAIALLVYNMFKSPSASPMETEAMTELPVEVDKSIAVLAFADMSPEKDQEYFSDGISEEILNLLAKIPDLKVISRTSSFSYKGKEQNIKKIGEELQVGHVLEGSIRKSGNTFRITTQLINITSGAHIWSETYDRDMTDIFKIQDEIAAAVTTQLKLTILGKKFETKTVNTDAFNLYLQAKQLREQVSSESTKNALKLIKESIAIDSIYAPAWALLSNIIYDAAFRRGIISYNEGLIEGKIAAKKAVSLDPNYAYGYIQLANFESFSWNFEVKNELLEKAMLLDPHNPEVINAKSSSASNFGKKDLAIELQLKTLELDPLNTLHYFNLGLFYWMNKNYTKAEASLNKYLLISPNSGFGNNIMGQVQISMGRPEVAISYLEKDTDPFWNLYRKTMAIYGMGKQEEANTLLKQLVTDWGHDSWPNIAHVYAYRGEKDNAFKWLELANSNKDASLLEILNYPEMENLWGDPRWNTFINKLGLPKDHGFHLD